MKRLRVRTRRRAATSRASHLFRVGILAGAALLYLLVANRVSATQGEPQPTESADAMVAQARLRSDEGDLAGAASLLERALERQPDHDAARFLLARVLSWSRRYDESIAAYETLIARRPADALARAGYARALGWAGRHGDAAREFRVAVAMDSTNLETRVGLARVLSWSGDLPGSEIEYRRILRADPEHGDAWLGLAAIARWRGAAAGADRFLARARRHGADRDALEEEENTVRIALAAHVGVGWSSSVEREDVTAAPSFKIEATGPFAEARAVAGRAVGVSARATRLLLFEEPSGDSLNYDLKASAFRANVSYDRGYPIQASVGVEYRRFEQRPSPMRYPLGDEDDFVGYHARASSHIGRFTPSVAVKRDFIAIKDTTAAGARFIDPGHEARLDGSLAYQWNARGTLTGSYSTGDYSDGNRRWTLGGGVAYRVRSRLPRLTLDYGLSASDWDRRSASYFTPLRSTRHLAGVSLSGYAERGNLDYGARYLLSRIDSSTFDDIWTHGWSGYANAAAGGSVPLGLEVSYTIDNNDYATWFVGVHGGIRW